MVNSLRLLTFNTQLRSWAMEAGEDLDPFFAETAGARARVISRRILASPYDYDVIGLMEVFDEDAREVLKSDLSSKYPWNVTKCDVESISLQILQASTALSTSAVLIAYGLAGLVNTTFEDSGLMLFSRFPFAKDSRGDPVVAYWPYTSASGGDSYAAKGALLARVLLDVTYNPCDIVISHTQAAYASDEENSEDRLGQFTEAANLIGRLSGAPPPDDREVFFMGDLNVVGNYTPSKTPNRPGVAGGEWTGIFNNPDSYLTGTLYDLWAHEQSPGLAFAEPGAVPGDLKMPYGEKWDLGLSTTDGKRLDYILGRTRGGDRLAAQHLQVAYELVLPNPAVDGLTVPYTSDHLPVRADFAAERAYCRAATALVAPADLVDWNHAGTLRPGAMKWHRFDESGAYAFRVDTEGAGAAPDFEVYVATSLSQPYAPYRAQVDRHGLKYVLPSAPFFVRVFAPDRTADTGFRLYAHRYTGASREEAITLPSRIEVPHVTTSTGPLNDDDPATPWDERDCVWFCVESDVTDAGGEQTFTFRLRDSYDTAIFTLLVLVEQPGGGLASVKTAPAQRRETSVSWSTSKKEKFYILARRNDPRYLPGSPQSFSANAFSVQWWSNLSYIYGLKGGRPGRPLTLACEDETNGFLGLEIGADDIRMRLTTDGTLIRPLSQDEVGPMNEGGQSDLERFLDVIRYVDSYKVDLIEVDVDENDDASITIPTFADCEQHSAFHLEAREEDGTVHGYFRLDFGDGKYRFYCSVSPFLPL